MNLKSGKNAILEFLQTKKNNVTIYGSNDNIELRSVNDDYKLKEDSEGNSRLSWVCVDDEGKKCMPILISDKAVTFIYLAIHYPDKGFAIFYNLVPDRSQAIRCKRK